MTITKIATEIILVVIIYAASLVFWLTFKRQKYLLQVLSNKEHLQSFVSGDVFANPSQLMKHFAEKEVIDFSVNFILLNRSDKKTITYIKVASMAILVLAIIIGAHIYLIFILINIAISFASSKISLSDGAKKSTLHHILCLAYIIHTWDAKDRESCKKFFMRNDAFQKLYEVRTQVRQA